MVVAAEGNGYRLDVNQQFDPPDGATVRRLRNWPASDADEPTDDRLAGNLLLGGTDESGSWWFEIAGFAGPNEAGCWPIYGGPFESEGSIHFSSGLRIPKARDFTVVGADDVSNAFPGHQDDYVCIDAGGVGVYFELFRGR